MSKIPQPGLEEARKIRQLQDYLRVLIFYIEKEVTDTPAGQLAILQAKKLLEK